MAGGGKTKLVKLPKMLSVKMRRARTEHHSHMAILNTTRIGVKNDSATKVSKLANGNELHG